MPSENHPVGACFDCGAEPGCNIDCPMCMALLDEPEVADSLAKTIAEKAAEIRDTVGKDPWGARPAPHRQEFAAKIGSTYKTRSGEIVGPLFVSSVSNALVGIIGGLRVCWNSDGTTVGADEYPHPFDLVAEIWDMDGTTYPICPHCGREERDAWEFNFGPGLEGETVITCGYCDREYDTTRNVSVSYTTKVKPNA